MCSSQNTKSGCADTRHKSDGDPEDLLNVFIGVLVPPEEAKRFPACVPAGNMLQYRFVKGGSAAGLCFDRIFSVLPMSSWSKGGTSPLRAEKVDSHISGIPVTYLRFLNLGPLKTLSHGLELLKELLFLTVRKRNRSMCIIAYNGLAPSGFFLVIAKWIFRLKLVMFMADIDRPKDSAWGSGFTKWLQYWGQLFAFRNSDKAIVLNRRMIDDFNFTGEFLVLPGLLDENTVETLGKVRKAGNGAACSHPKVRFLYLGNIDRIRGAEILLEAFILVQKSWEGDRDIELVLAGPDNLGLDDYLEQCGSISYLGKLPYEEALEVYSGADFLVNPHRCDYVTAGYHFPSKFIEYLATGIPVISTNYGDVASLFSGYYLEVEKDDAESLRAALEQALIADRNEMLKIAEDARKMIGEGFTWVQSGKKIKEFLDNN